MKTLKMLLESDVSISEKGEAIYQLYKEQDALFTESKKLTDQMNDLTKQYQDSMQKLSREQERIMLKQAAISEAMQKLIK